MGWVSMATYTFKDGSEVRTVSVDEDSDGSVRVRQESRGEVTELAFGADAHADEIVFFPTEEYGLQDVLDDIERRGSDFFLTDLADNLQLWGIAYSSESHDESRGARRP